MKENYILVTGAAGFIGSSVAKKLIELGHHVITIDNLSTGKKENLPKNIIFYKGNVYDKKILNEVFKYKISSIIHIAGQSSGEISFEDPIYDLKSNTQSTLLLLKFAIKNNCKKFVFASTMSVYGNQSNELVNERNFPNPISFYSVGKLASESYMKIYSKLGINCIALRLFNVYGPGQNLGNLKQGMVSIFLSQAINNNSIVVKGSGERFRDMVYIDDVVDAFIKSIKHNSSGYKFYNVSTAKKTKVIDVINLIKKLSDNSIAVNFQGETPGDMFGIYGDNSLIKSELEWIPKTNFENGIQNMYNWAINKKDGEINK